jgi:hypothetical protein
MGDSGWIVGRLTAAAVVVLGIGLVLTTSVDAERPVAVGSGNVEMQINGGVSPKEVSKKVPSPVALTIEGRVRTVDGTHPPRWKSSSSTSTRTATSM